MTVSCFCKSMSAVWLESYKSPTQRLNRQHEFDSTSHAKSITPDYPSESLIPSPKNRHVKRAQKSAAMSQRPSKDQADYDRLLRNLSQSEVSTLLAAIDTDTPNNHRSLFARAERLWNRPLQGHDGEGARTSLPKDLERLAIALQWKAWDHRHPGTPPWDHSRLDHDIAVKLSVLRIYTVRDLKPSEKEAVEKYLREIVNCTEALRGTARFVQEKAVRGIILRVQGLVLYLEDM